MVSKHPFSYKIVPTADDPNKFRVMLLEDGHWIGSPLEPYNSRVEAEDAGREEVDKLVAGWIFDSGSSGR
jgi:hypothetical protein